MISQITNTLNSGTTQVGNAAGGIAGVLSNSIGNSLGFLMNLVPVPGKLIIIPVRDFNTVPTPAGPPYIAMFNPENWQQKTKVHYESNSKQGSKGEQQNFDRVPAPSLSFDLLIDGTGASGQIREVLADIQFLEKIILFDGKVHQPNSLFIIWGTQIFKGKAVTMNVKHTLFRPNGTPLRAVVSLEFIEHKNQKNLTLEMDLHSSDLTQIRTVKENDRLDLICHQIYENPRYYLDVAAANQMTSFRKLSPGGELIFPPIEK